MRWDRLILNVNLATMAGNTPYGAVEQAALAITDRQIAWLGPMSDLPANPEELATEIFRAGGMWATPGLIDCHTHLLFAGSRAEEFEQRLCGASYEQIAEQGGGIMSTVRATRTASDRELIELGSSRIRQLQAEGVTTVEIKSGYGLDVEHELRLLRIARRLADRFAAQISTTLLALHAVPPEYAGKADDYVELVCNKMLPAAAAEGLVDAVDAYCESIAFSPAQVSRVFDCATELEIPVKLHADQLSDTGGAALAAKYQALSADHLEYTNQEGVAAMAAAGTVAVLIPAAFYSLRETQLPPIELMREHRVPMAVATDCNPGTSPISSLTACMNLACTLFGLTPEESLTGATRHAASALGVSDRIGTLEVGKQADIVLWEVSHPAQLSWWIGGQRCRRLYKAGEVVF